MLISSLEKYMIIHEQSCLKYPVKWTVSLKFEKQLKNVDIKHYQPDPFRFVD